MLPNFSVALILLFVSVGQNDTIPKELVSVLLRGPGAMPTENFDIKIGPPPSGFPRDVLPPNAPVAVSAISDRGTTVVAEAAQLAAGQRSGFLASLSSRGWMSPAPPRRGFVTGPLSTVFNVCRDQDFVLLSFVDRTAGGSFVRVAWTHDPRRACPARQPGMGDAFFADVTIPELQMPSEVRATSGGASANSNSWTSNATVSGSTPSALTAHFTPQLVAAGWRMQGAAIEAPGISVVHFSIPSRANDAVIGLLSVMAIAGTGQNDLFLRVVRAGDGRGGFNSSLMPIIR